MKRVSVRFADKEYEDLVKLGNQSERSLNDLKRAGSKAVCKRRHERLKPLY